MQNHSRRNMKKYGLSEYTRARLMPHRMTSMTPVAASHVTLGVWP